MIIEFSVANFRSFKTLQTLSFVAANITSKDKKIDENNVIEIPSVASKKMKLLKSKAIYGANASGKSNIVKALSAFWRIIRHSVKNEKVISNEVQKFELSTETVNEPTFFQLIFIHENVTYRYGFEVKENKIFAEWLFGNPKGVEVPFFTRENREVKVNERSFKEAKKYESLLDNENNEIFRDNSLFLASVSAMGEKTAKSLVTEILSISMVSSANDPVLKELMRAEMLKGKEKEADFKVMELLRTVDNIEQVEMTEIDKEDLPEEVLEELIDFIHSEEWHIAPNFHSIRNVYDAQNEMQSSIKGNFEEWESEGTKKFFYLSPLLIVALEKGEMLIIDEFDARLHPLLTHKIVSLFNSSITNPKGAQLLFVTHDTSFLQADIMRRDQICFVEKDKFGSSTLKTLVEFKGVRNDASFEKDYLQGKYGAVKFLNDLENAFIQ